MLASQASEEQIRAFPQSSVKRAAAMVLEEEPASPIAKLDNLQISAPSAPAVTSSSSASVAAMTADDEADMHDTHSDEDDDGESEEEDEDWRTWKKNTLVLYDTLLHQRTEWPSLTIDWYREVERYILLTSTWYRYAL